jgi:multicomponent Na+:H+ antiporter subunit E
MASRSSSEAATGNRVWRFVLLSAVLAMAWFILSGGAPSSWFVGIPAIALCMVVIRRLPSEGPWRWTVAGILEFLPYFIWQSIRSGLQVAWFAVHPRVPLSPRLLYYDVSLANRPARVFFANSVSLLPGTLSCILAEGLLVVHALTSDPSVEDDLATLENKVARLFGLAPGKNGADE